jgi:hypothetical protein
MADGHCGAEEGRTSDHGRENTSQLSGVKAKHDVVPDTLFEKEVQGYYPCRKEQETGRKIV